MLDPRNVPADRAPGARAATAVRGALVPLAGLGAVLVLVALLLGRDDGGTGPVLLMDAGVGLLTVGAVGLVVESVVARARSGSPVDGTPVPAVERRAGGSGEHGFEDVREDLDLVDVLRSVEPGEELWWMETFPLTLAGDLDAVHRALRAGVRVRLLVLDPRSPAMAARVHEVRHRYGLSPMDVRRGFDTLSNQLRALGRTDPVVPEHLEVRSYDGLPGAPVFLVVRAREQDGGRTVEVVRAFSSYYLLDASQDMPYLEWRGGVFADRLRAYFEQKWAEALVVFPVEPHGRPDTVVPGNGVPLGGGGDAPRS